LNPPPSQSGDDNARLFIQKGSRMNNGEFDEGFGEEDPF
jgi:replicative DNA helicase